MAEQTGIEWTHHTFNPWWGCAKVSPACDHCYAERDAKRFVPGRVLWGVDAERRTFGDKHWHEPVKWNAKAASAGERHRVFCASMGDVFDNKAPADERARLWDLIRATPDLDWLLLTKRIGNAFSSLPLDFNGKRYPNVWLGITVVNQAEADRDIPKLLSLNAAVRFLSIEPMIGPIDLTSVLWPNKGGHRVDVLRGGYWNKAGCLAFGPSAELGEKRGGFTNHSDMNTVDWVIAGGESGPHARPSHPDWFRSLRDQCADAKVPFLFKQWGEWAPVNLVADDDERNLAGRWIRPDGSEPAPGAGVDFFGGDEVLYRVGKKAAGRTLDGVAHDGYPHA